MSDALAVIATAWGVFMGVSPLLVGFVWWAAYGISIANLALVISNSVSLVVGSATILVARSYRVGRS